MQALGGCTYQTVCRSSVNRLVGRGPGGPRPLFAAPRLAPLCGPSLWPLFVRATGAAAGRTGLCEPSSINSYARPVRFSELWTGPEASDDVAGAGNSHSPRIGLSLSEPVAFIPLTSVSQPWLTRPQVPDLHGCGAGAAHGPRRQPAQHLRSDGLPTRCSTFDRILHLDSLGAGQPVRRHADSRTSVEAHAPATQEGPFRASSAARPCARHSGA